MAGLGARLLGTASALFLGYVAVNRLLETRPAPAAIDPQDDAAEAAGHYGAARAAGPQSMRDDGGNWDEVDEASDESFPASDPPASY
jgi:hypothetical protein